MQFKRTVGVEAQKLRRLRVVSRHTRIPVNALIREGIERVLVLAETQQRTVERFVK